MPVTGLSTWLSVQPRKIGECVGTCRRCSEEVSIAGLQFGAATGKDVCQDCLPVWGQVLGFAAAVRLLPTKQKRYKTLLHRQEVSCPRMPAALTSCRHEIWQRSTSYHPCTFCLFFLDSPGSAQTQSPFLWASCVSDASCVPLGSPVPGSAYVDL